MAKEKEKIVIDDTQALIKINKRLDVVDKNYKKITIRNRKNNEKNNLQEKEQKQEIYEMKEEMKKLDKEISRLKKITFKTGNKLKMKVSTEEIEHIESELKKWKLEEYIRRDELIKTYEHYDKDSSIF